MATANLDHLALVFVLFLLHLLVPGPNMFYICACAARGGRHEALCFAAGTSLGTAAWAAFTAMGLNALFDELPRLVALLQWAVGGLLFFFGAQAIRSAWFGSKSCAVRPGRRGRRAVLQGLVLTVANVNELVFWSAVLVLGAGSGVAATGTGALDDPVSISLFVVAVGAAAFAFDGALAWLAGSRSMAGPLMRLRPALEFALGIVFCAGGGLLLGLL
ncbi:MAG: LysE family transporter [Geminicoccaceae bacterium]|nr:LysE family transporter [Geminicoccaceae bacterium]